MTERQGGSVRRRRRGFYDGRPGGVRGLQQNDKNANDDKEDDENNNDKNNNDKNQEETPAPTRAPTASPTRNPTAAPTLRPTSRPTGPPTRAPTASPISPTNAPTIDEVFEESIELRFSTFTASQSGDSVTVEEYEPVLVDILNLAMCSTGVRLVTMTYQDACPEVTQLVVEDADSITDPTIVWNRPLVEATWVSDNIWQWNYTYSVLESGNQTNEFLQGLLNISIEDGRMDAAMPWPSSQAIVVGREAAFMPALSPGIPTDMAKALRAIGYVLLFLSLLAVNLLTFMARRRRTKRQEWKAAATAGKKDGEEALNYSVPNHCMGHPLPDMVTPEARLNASVEAMLLQSKQYAVANGPASLLEASKTASAYPQSLSSEDCFVDEDDVMLGLEGKKYGTSSESARNIPPAASSESDASVVNASETGDEDGIVLVQEDSNGEDTAQSTPKKPKSSTTRASSHFVTPTKSRTSTTAITPATPETDLNVTPHTEDEEDQEADQRPEDVNISDQADLSFNGYYAYGVR